MGGGGGENIRTIEQLNENLSLSAPTNYDADCRFAIRLDLGIGSPVIVAKEGC